MGKTYLSASSNTTYSTDANFRSISIITWRKRPGVAIILQTKNIYLILSHEINSISILYRPLPHIIKKIYYYWVPRVWKLIFWPLELVLKHVSLRLKVVGTFYSLTNMATVWRRSICIVGWEVHKASTHQSTILDLWFFSLWCTC